MLIGVKIQSIYFMDDSAKFDGTKGKTVGIGFITNSAI